VVLTLAQYLRPDCPVDLPLVVLPGLAEYGKEHDPAISSTPVRDPRRNITQPDPQLPDRSFEVVRPRAAQFRALLGEHPAYFVDPLEVVIAEAVEPIADLWFELEVMQAPYSPAHAWSDYRAK